MGTSIAKRTPSMPLNSVEPRMAKASIAINPPQTPDLFGDDDAVVSLFFECVAAIGMAEKEAAYHMAMDPAQLSRVKSAQARLPLDAVWRMPLAFWVEFGRRLLDAKGISEETRREQRAARIAELVKLLVEVA